MLAQRLDFPGGAAVLNRGEWIYERKLDGLRCSAVRRGPSVELWSRNHLSFNRRFPGVVSTLASWPVDRFVLDGEIVAFVGDQTSFQRLQSGAAADTAFVVFDLLHLLGRDVTSLALSERTALLARMLPAHRTGVVRRSAHLAGHPEHLMAAACADGWEGLVAKRAGSRYRSGRSPDWRKLKCTARQDLVIGGWTDPGGARTGFGALLVGYYREGDLVYAGKVGTGFDQRTLRQLHARLRAAATDRPPFRDPPAERGAHWSRPELVAEISFTEWTHQGRLRHPSFLGLREDQDPRHVVREAQD
ncbi:MAG: non-homologous end-joining DNA ligase [Actinomycetota bacterium]|nr:non-homologous end-joining DNA ligase [Actinomycetota bacterium]